MSDDDKKRLQDNKRLAQQLGAAIETSYGDDVPYQIAEFARLSGVPNLDIHVIPDASTGTAIRKKRVRRR